MKQEVTIPNEEVKVSELEKMKHSLELQLQEMTKKVREQQVQIAMANLDPLTGLRNRAGVSEEVDDYLKRTHEGTFIIMDLDNFKGVNDTYGHIEGDAALQKFARTIEKSFTKEDIIARIGGDEFIIFLPYKKSKEDLKKKALKLVRRVERELISPGKLMKITTSVGIAMAPEAGLTFEALYRKADCALYEAKHQGKNMYCFFDEIELGYHRHKRNSKASLTQIMNSMKEKKMEGSFLVEYESFEKIYRFIERNIARENRDVQCLLFTMDDDDGEADETELQIQMEHFQHAITSTLRKGDVTTNYSRSQYLVLLMDTSIENAKKVVERILEKYKAESKELCFPVMYEVETVCPEKAVI